jgi:hypothetical protein
MFMLRSAAEADSEPETLPKPVDECVKGYIIARDPIGCRNRREALRRLAKNCLTFQQPSIFFVLKA